MFVHRQAGAIWAQRSATAEAFEGLTAVLALYADVLRSVATPFRSLVSLGAATGVIDKYLIETLGEPRPTYIPVDLSAHLCEAALRATSGVCNAPLGIVADFESRLPFVAEAASPKLSPPLLICCTGNAIGNLDRGEKNFFTNVRAMMSTADALLISFATGHFPQPMTRPVFDATVGWEDLRELLACSVEVLTGEPAETVAPALDERLSVAPGASDVPGADALRLVDKLSNRTLVHLRRYTLGSMSDWIATRFRMQVLAAQEISVSAGVGIGALLARVAR
jgi:hypothetical protein